MLECFDAGSAAGRHDGVEVVTWPPGRGCAWEKQPLRGETTPPSGTTAPAALNSAAMKDELVADFGIASPPVSVTPFGINILDGVYGTVFAKQMARTEKNKIITNK